MNKHPRDCANQTELIQAALFAQHTAPKGIEYNFPATIITTIGGASLRGAGKMAHIRQDIFYVALQDIELTAQMGMIQIALLNMGVNPGSAFIVTAAVEGWRFHPAHGFRRLA